MAFRHRERVSKAKIEVEMLKVPMPTQLKELLRRRFYQIFLASLDKNFPSLSALRHFKAEVRVGFALNTSLGEVPEIIEWISFEHFGRYKLEKVCKRLAVQSTLDGFRSQQVAHVCLGVTRSVALVNFFLKVVQPNLGDSFVVPYHVIQTVFAEPLVVVLVAVGVSHSRARHFNHSLTAQMSLQRHLQMLALPYSQAVVVSAKIPKVLPVYRKNGSNLRTRRAKINRA